jgi:hypothetical protein
MAPQTVDLAIGPGGVPKKKPISYSNLLLGAGLNMFEYVSHIRTNIDTNEIELRH